MGEGEKAQVVSDEVIVQAAVVELAEQTTKELTGQADGSKVNLAKSETNGTLCPRCRSSKECHCKCYFEVLGHEKGTIRYS